MIAPKVLFYVQHLLGIGHLARASRLARAMIAAGFKVTLVTGGRDVPGFPGDDIPHVALPPVAVRDGGFKGLVDATGAAVDDAYMARRRDLLVETFHATQPDIVMIEAFPFGRRQVRFELFALIEAIEATRPRPKLVTSLRDILQRQGKPERDVETVEQVRAHFDRVLVHGDPAFAALGDSFPLADAIADKVVYTGLVCAPRPTPSPERYDVLVSAGGGAVGAEVVRTALEAAALLPDLPRWGVIAGPNLPQSSYDDLARKAPPNVTLMRFRADFPNLLASTRLSVSQGGYNTVGDILQAGCRSLLIPYTSQGETEQADRAERLERLGRAVVLPDVDLNGSAMAAAIRRALAQDISRDALAIATDGTGRTVKILQQL